MSFINNNWYMALAFCLAFFIVGRRLGETAAELGLAAPNAAIALKFVLIAFALPSLLFPLALLPVPAAASPWYNAFRSVNRIELFNALIAPAAGYATFLKDENPNDVYRAYRAPAPSPILRIIKPLAFPLCLLFVTVNFAGPLLNPLDKGTVFADAWADGDVCLQTAGTTAGPSALISVMYSLNKFTDSELAVAKGTYTDGNGSKLWYLARYAASRGYGIGFIRPDGIGNAPVPAVVPVTRTDADVGDDALSVAAGGDGSYVALLRRTGSGILTVGDPSAGRIEMNADDFVALYGEPEIVLAVSAPRKTTDPNSADSNATDSTAADSNATDSHDF